MSANIEKLLQAVEDYKEPILAAERHIWKNPETGYREWKTHAYMKEHFESLGYTVKEAGNIPGFYADVETGIPGPMLGIFAELDSLIVPTHPEADPATGYVHACGHHCQCAAMLGIAAAFKAEGALDGLCGTIRLLVVPAEELIEINYRQQLKDQGIIRYFGGKVEFMARGILDGVDLSMMVHTSVGVGVGCSKGSNGCITKEVTYLGKGSHAGGAPHNGINALYAANLGMQAANALRETFQEKDYIRFHPIITNGGDAVNAIPDHVTIESYVRGATVEAIAKENEKINRALAGAAAAMGCKLQLKDLHGYAPRLNDANMKQIFKEAALTCLPVEKIKLSENWGTGCSDMGDVNCIMPSMHPYAGGAKGAAHSSEYQIVDPYTACVVSAKVQVATAAMLLQDDAAKAKQVLAEAGQDYPTIPEYLASIDKLCFNGDCVTYAEDGTVQLKFKN